MKSFQQIMTVQIKTPLVNIKSILQTLHYILPCNLKHYISYLCEFIFDN